MSIADVPRPYAAWRPPMPEFVFAVIDTASKKGTDHDATAVTYFARNSFGTLQLFILDWDIAQIEGAILGTWLPWVFERLEELSRLCGARYGSVGAFIKDKNSGTILLHQGRKRDRPAHDIDSKPKTVGKDKRAMSASGYIHKELVKYTDHAFHKTVTYKRHSRNHLLDQTESFRMGDKGSNREDDLPDTFCYGIAVALGNEEGF
jgi:hypothetical protein